MSIASRHDNALLANIRDLRLSPTSRILGAIVGNGAMLSFSFEPFFRHSQQYASDPGVDLSLTTAACPKQRPNSESRSNAVDASLLVDTVA